MRVHPKTVAEENREEIYKFIVRYIAEHCYPPSFREIAKGVGVSDSTARRHVKDMIECEILESDLPPGEERAFRLTGTKVVKKGTKKRE